MKQIGILMVLVLSWANLPAEVTIRTEASFGAKKKDCLRGVGMCSAKTTTNAADDRLVVSLTLSDDESTLTLGLASTTMEEVEGQIVRDKFIQEEDYGLPAEISRALGIIGILMIPAGSYPVLYADGQVLVKIPVNNQAGLR